MDEIASLDWDIIPKDEYKYEWVAKAIKEVKEFLMYPNKNREPFSYLIRALVKDILEIDAGVIVKVFDVNSYDFDNIEPKSGAPMLKPKGQRRLTELYVRDGACLKFGSMIETDLGFIPIGKIVNDQIKCNVKSFNRDTGQIEWKPITNWYSNGISTDWITIKAKTNKKFRSLTCTPNHNIYTEAGYVPANNLNVGDKIYTQQEKLSPDQHQIILGSLLGDASLSCGGSEYSKYKLSETHCVKQRDYLMWKADMLSPLGINIDNFLSSYGKGYEPTEKVRISTRANIIFEDYYYLKYPNLTTEIVNDLNEIGLAVWIQDDGNFNKGAYSISCGNVAFETLIKIAKKLENKFKINFKVRKGTRENLIEVGRAEGQKLKELIKPYIHPSMSYKVNGEKCGQKLDKLSKETTTEIIETEIYKKSAFQYYDARYDIEVADNHNFFAQGILVSNSFLKEIDKFGFEHGFWQYCMTKENIIDTQSGFKNADEITTTDFVLGNDGKYHKVLDNYKREYSGEFVTIKAQGLPEITCTKEHPFLVKTEYGTEWIEAGELSENNMLISQTPIDTHDIEWIEVYDRSSKEFYWKTMYNEAIKLYAEGLLPWQIADVLHIKRYGKRQPMIRKWVVGKVLPKCYNIPDKIKVDNDFLELAGWFLAEGCVIKGSVIDFTLSILETEYADRISQLMYNIFGLSSSKVQQDNAIHIRFFSKVVSAFFTRHFGKGARYKKIPQWIMRLPQEKQSCLLDSFNKGDGYQSNKQLGFVTASRNLAWQLRTLLMRQGAYSSISFVKGKEHEFKGRIIKSNGFWTLTIKAQEYLDKLSFNTIHKLQGRGGLVQLMESQFLVPIQKITKKLRTDTVYNIHVADVHCFTANGVITHNSYQIPAHPMWFNRDEIVYIQEHSRSMSCYGYARTQSILDIVKSLHYSTLYNKRFFEETPIPDGALSLLDTNETEMRSFMSYWNNEFKAQPHKVAIMNKDIKWQPFAVSQRELEFLDTQKWYFNMVISAFGLSPSELGVTDNLNRATSATQSELVKRKGVRPFLRLLEDFINKGVISEFGYDGIQFQFIYDDPAEKNERLANWNLELTMGVKTINEVRNEMGLEPIEGGDVSNNMRSLFGGSNYSIQPNTNQEDKRQNDTEQRESQDYPEVLHREESKNEKNAPLNFEKPGMGRSDEWWDIYHALIEQGHSKESAARIASSKIKKSTDTFEFKNDGDAKEILRSSIASELSAISLYENLANKTNDTELKTILLDIAQEEKVHVGEFQMLLDKLDSENEESRAEGEREAEQVVKGLYDGQYYFNQPISQPMKPSGAMYQPQNQRIGLRDGTGPFRNNPDCPNNLINCPICGMPTLTALESEENLEDDLRCSSCGARFRKQDLLNAPMMEEMTNILNTNLATKSLEKVADDKMTIKEFCGFDVHKSLPWASEYASTPKYFKLLSKYLSDLSETDIKSIIEILKDDLTGNFHIFDIAQHINEVINDYTRAQLIARTEVIRIANEGHLGMMEAKGTKYVKWIAAPEDGRLCKLCKEKDGKIFTVAEAHGMIPLHPRCRCGFTEVEDY